jgi:hypothetical protein
MIFTGVTHKSSLNGIEMDVAHELEKVTVLLDEQGTISALEQMACAPVAPIRRTRILGCDPLHESPQRRLTNLHRNMEMISHPTVSVNPAVVALAGDGNEAIEPTSIIIVEEQRLAIVTT